MNMRYTISIYTENNVGLLNRISAIFLKRHINIVSITSSESEITDIFRFIIVVDVDENQIIKLIKQIEKQIEVISAFFHTNDEIIYLETALYKVNLNLCLRKDKYKTLLRKVELIWYSKTRIFCYRKNWLERRDRRII